MAEKKKILQIDDIPENAVAGEVAEFFRIDIVTARVWIREGKFPNAYKPDKRWRIPKQDIIDLMHAMYGKK